MNILDCVSINEACQILETYDQLFTNLAILHGRKIVRKGRTRYVSRETVEFLRPHVEAVKNRPRLSKPLATATA
jgi:hypothetical protein